MISAADLLRVAMSAYSSPPRSDSSWRTRSPSLQSRGARMISHEPRLRAADAAPTRVRHCIVPDLARLVSRPLAAASPGSSRSSRIRCLRRAASIDTSETSIEVTERWISRWSRPGALAAYLVFPLLQNNLPGRRRGGPDANRDRVSQLRGRHRRIASSGRCPPRCSALFRRSNGRRHNSAEYALAALQRAVVGQLGSGGRQVRALGGRVPDRARGADRCAPATSASRARRCSSTCAFARFGSTTTQDIESDPLDYPVYVCAGCLIANASTCPFPSAPSTRAIRATSRRTTPWIAAA